MKHEVQRMCIACREMKDKQQLIRIVKTTENDVFIDLSAKSNGRGCYICHNIECINKLIKNKLINKNLKCNVANEIYEKIKELTIGESKAN